MTKYLSDGKSFNPLDEKQTTIHDKLAPGNYSIVKDPMSGSLYFQQMDSFTNGHKIYGDTESKAERIIQTFEDRESATGVMLAGEKGSGKTLLARMISILGYKRDYPTIVINAPWHGEMFNQLIQSVDQPCVVIFDEFEKVYNRETQEAVLTLLDGTYPSKKLFILTVNNEWLLNDAMHNRPGRLFYKLKYGGLDVNFIREYTEDTLLNKDNFDSVLSITDVIPIMNFDMLKALIEEMNRYDENAKESLAMLNIGIGAATRASFDIDVWHKGEKVPTEMLKTRRLMLNPLDEDGISISIFNTPSEVGQPSNRRDWDYIELDDTDLTNISNHGSIFEYNTNEYRVILTKVQAAESSSMWSMLA